MNRILLLGAGFSRNWNGRLASEVRNDLQLRLSSDPHLSQLLKQHDFETALSKVQAEYACKRNPITEQRLQRIQDAIGEVFAGMNQSFRQRSTMEFTEDSAFHIRSYLAQFEAIFTLNQDLLLEIHYRINDPTLRQGTKWTGCVIPGMVEHVQQGNHLYDVLQSKWHPRGDFQVETGKQPLIKLHGSTNWETGTAAPMLIMGKGKLGLINQHPVLKEYFEYFVRCLSKPDTRLVVIGYGFADDHINQALVQAGQNGTMQMFVIHPRGRGILVRQPDAVVGSPDEPLRDKIPLLGASERELSRTFKDDDIQLQELYRAIR